MKTCTEIAAGLRSEWLDLLERDSMGDPRLHPGWILDPASGPRPVIYTERNRTRLRSLAVLRPERTRPLGTGPSLVSYTLVCDRLMGDGGPESCTAFAGALARSLASGAVDYIQFNDLEQGSPLWDALHAIDREHGATLHCHRTPPARWWVDLPAQPERYWAKFSSKTRGSLRYRVRKLQKLGSEFLAYTSPQDMPALTAAITTLYPSTWQHRRHGLAGSPYLSEPGLWEFVANLGALRSYVLWLQGRPLAYVVGTQWNHHFITIETGYDTAHRELGAGTVLTYLMLEDLIARRSPHVVDWGFGDYDYKRVFSTRSTHSGRALLVARRLRPQCVARLAFTALEARLLLSAVLKRIGIFQQVKRLYHKA